MITIKDLSSVIDDHILHELYLARDLTLADITKNDKNNLKKLQDKEKMDYVALISIIENIKGISQDNTKIIRELIETQVDNNIQINTYFNEKLYKTGVIDGMRLILESRCKKNVK